MELEVLNPRGIPKSGVLSISVGGTRRQVQLSALDRPLIFPGKAEEVSQIKVDVLDVLGRARLPYEPSVEKYTVPLDAADAQSIPAPESMELDLIVRAYGGQPAERKEDSEAYRKHKEAEANNYLEEHGLVNFMQFLLTSLMQDKPADPYPFLQKQVAMKMSTKADSKASTAPADTVPASPVAADAAPEPAPTPVPVTVPEIEEASLVQGTFVSSRSASKDTHVAALLKKLTPRTAASCPAEEISKLEKEALLASERLRSDNAKLREHAMQLKSEYEALMEESGSLHAKLDAKQAAKKAAAMNPPVLPFGKYYGRFVAQQCQPSYWKSFHARFFSPAALNSAGSSSEAARQFKEAEEQLQKEKQAARLREEAEEAKKAAKEETARQAKIAEEELQKQKAACLREEAERRAEQEVRQAKQAEEKLQEQNEAMKDKNAAAREAFREIQKLQEEVSALARENAKLVADLARGREMIDSVRKDIMAIQESME